MIQLLFSKALDMTERDEHLVALDDEVSTRVLSGILGVNVSQIYSFRKDGKLPFSPRASLRKCLLHHLDYYRSRSLRRAGNVGDADLIQKIKLNKAKTEQTWLAVRKERGELVDVELLSEQFEPHFLHLRMQLHSLARKHPELREGLDKVLEEWSLLGEKLMRVSKEQLGQFIQKQLEDEPDYDKDDEPSSERNDEG